MGLPNAGKSTLLARVSRARPRIADYPFTTLHPGLGVVGFSDEVIVLADIPGLIEGAHAGAGLGDRFLGHIERCGALLHLVDATGPEPLEAYRVVREELAAYGAGLEDKPEVVALTKTDGLRPGRRRRARRGPRPAVRPHRAPDLRGRRAGPRPDAVRSAAGCPGPAQGGGRGRGRRMGAALTGPKPVLGQSGRLVVKIGSALLVRERDGRVRRDWLGALGEDIDGLRRRGVEVIVVSSGAIAVGCRHLGLDIRSLRLEEKQAAAATGQIRLAHAWQEMMARHGITVSQILLSPDDTERRRRHLNARATISTLLSLGALPVINENDTVATAEIRFGDNDRLSARVAQMVSADTLLLLSDVDGLYDRDPRADPSARHIPDVTRITPEIEAMAGSVGSEVASGGMVTKLAAARIATRAGCRMIIASGEVMRPLSAVEGGARCTCFAPTGTPRGARKNWIASALGPRRHADHRRWRRSGAAARPKPASRRGDPGSTGASSAATSWLSPMPAARNSRVASPPTARAMRR